jgi:hypothetical protein
MRGISGCTRRLIVEEEELAGVAMAMGLAVCKQAGGVQAGEGRGREEEPGVKKMWIEGPSRWRSAT